MTAVAARQSGSLSRFGGTATRSIPDARKDEVRARIAAYPEQLHEARSRAIYAKPNVRPGGELNSQVAKLNAKEKKDLDGLRALEADLSACRGVIAIEAQRVTEEATAEARVQLEEMHKQEERAWADAGKAMDDLVTAWNSYVEVVEQEDKLAGGSGIEVGVVAVEPAPLSFRAFLLLLLTAATDPAVRAEPHVQELTETGIFGRRDENGNALPGAYFDTRPAGTKTTEVRRKLDEHDRLFHLIPALGSIVRELQLSGRIPTITAE